jgi:lipopolysaccharide transport system ATP-binding protein
MSNIAISTDHLFKHYRLGSIGARTLSADLNRRWARLRGKPDPLLKIGRKGREKGADQDGSEEVWALKDVSFDVKHGEVLGIIGRNGAGKSTLLKILSRVTGPTSGEVRVKGRIASLLEVGTGFHPELTGRENVFLNGAILGMTKAEIRKKLDEIVDFSGIEKFIDTPVKRYSSGMYVRLAFSVAAHLEPEILIVDEVLSVGDAAFREKCLGKMQDVNRSEGRTVLLVSHDMATVEALCKRGLVLETGNITFDGEILDAVNHYLRPRASSAVVDELEDRVREGIGGARILSIRFEDDDSNLHTHFRMGKPVNMIVRVKFPTEIQNPIFGINLVTDRGVMVADCRSSQYGFKTGVVKGLVEYRMRIESLSLYPRIYIVEPWVADSNSQPGVDLDWVRNAATFVVTSAPDFLNGESVTSNHGISHIRTEWGARVISEEDSMPVAAISGIDRLRNAAVFATGS